MAFDPNQHKPDMSKRAASDSGIPLDSPGIFLLVFTFYKGRDVTPNGSPYLSFKAMVLGGKPAGHEGEYLWADVFINAKAYERLGALCASMGWGQSFDEMNDDDVIRVLLARPFKAKIRMEGKYARLAFAEMPTDGERAVMNRWAQANAEKLRENARARRDRQASGGGYGGGRGGGGGNRDWAPPDDADSPSGGGGDIGGDDFGGDDIPF